MTNTVDDLKRSLDSAYAATSPGSIDSRAAVLERARHLEPTARPSAGHRSPKRLSRTLVISWVSGIAALMLVLAFTLPHVIGKSSSDHGQRADELVPTGPPNLVAVLGNGTVAILSEKTGAKIETIKNLGAGMNFNVVSVTADGRTAYLGTDDQAGTGPTSPTLIERVPLDGERPTVVAPDAVSPAVSPDGTKLAYSNSDDNVIVQDLRNRSLRKWQLPNLGSSFHGEEPIVEHLSWLPDGVHLLVTIEIGSGGPLDYADGVEVLDTSNPVGTKNPRYLGPSAAMSDSQHPGGWSQATAVPGTRLVAVIAEEAVSSGSSTPCASWNSADSVVCFPVNYDSVVEEVDPSDGKVVKSIPPVPFASNQSWHYKFSASSVAFDGSDNPYVLGAWSCSGCSGPTSSTTTPGSNLYEDISGKLLEVGTYSPLLEAVAWLPHTFKI